jgi:quinoprotein glucose dehydrogenase
MRLSSSIAIGVWAAAAFALGASGIRAQAGTTGGQWRSFAGDLGSTRYAPLDQINADNFADLEVAWVFDPDNLGPTPDFNYQVTPLMIDGVLYATAGSRRNVVALDATTGELIWMYRLDEGERAENAIRNQSGRGVAYWTDGQGDERIYHVTIGYQLVALDAKTGRPVPTFGRNGIVDLYLEEDQEFEPLSV